MEERLMHVAEAKRRLGSRITWLADTMENLFHESMDGSPNAEMVVDPEGRVVARRRWSDPATLRADLERFVGPVDNPTRVTDLDLPTQPPPPTVARNVLPRLPMDSSMASIQVDPIIEDETPYYVKLRAEAEDDLRSAGSGRLYLGFFLDPLYRVHWNNEAGPVRFSITPPSGATVTPDNGTGPDMTVLADADPREFMLDVAGVSTEDPFEIDVFYFACDDALTFCVPVNQRYEVNLGRDNHGIAKRTGADNRGLPNNGRISD
jgi:hypothetical protein